MTGRRSLTVRAARLIQRIPLSWGRSIEKRLLENEHQNIREPRVVFLMGVPRSGSTLTYQVLIHAFQPLYLSNLWNLLYDLPWTGGRLSRWRCGGYESTFRADRGFVGGLCGPAEGLRFWSYWTGQGLSETDGVVTPAADLERRVAYLRDVLSALTGAECTMLAGYLGHALCPGQLQEWFPGAMFIRLHRDPLSNALSILKIRQAETEHQGWFSVFPRECEDALGKGIHAEVAAQVYWLNRRLGYLDADTRTIHVSYEDLCREPNRVVERVAAACRQNGLVLPIRRTIPGGFDYRLASPDDEGDAARLAEELQYLARRHGPLPTDATTV